MPTIRLDRLVKRYGSVEVLHGINLEMADNEFTVFVGPSGCGKSTTLRMIAGLEDVSDGEIYVDEKPVSHLEPKDRDLAMVFQDYALYPHMNVARNMSFALRLAKRPAAEIDRKVREVADILGLTDYLRRKPGELSGGQRQRVAMGRALVRDTGIFLLDEPLSNLDAKLRARMRTELAEMRARINKNFIYVTHDQVEAMTLGDRIVVMSEGHIQQQGSPEELFTNPVNQFVAGFIGSPAMNFLDGELAEEAGAIWVKGDGYQLPLPADQSARIGHVATARSVRLGMRPSSASIDAASGAPIDLTVVVAEYLGAQSVLVTRCGGAEVLVEVPSAAGRMHAGETHRFGVRTEEIMVFDRASGLRL
ncbi:MAG: ABC transporter ATP-binding protein [Pseudomonadota bacterium]